MNYINQLKNQDSWKLYAWFQQNFLLYYNYPIIFFQNKLLTNLHYFYMLLKLYFILFVL